MPLAVDSPLLEKIPPIDLHRAVVLTPTSFTTWAAMWAQHPDALDYLLGPGDYTSWGDLVVGPRSGARDRRRTIRYHDPG